MLCRRALAVWFTIGLVVFMSAAVEVMAVPAESRDQVLTQPDGTEFTARQWGDEWMNGWETATGHSIMKDQTGSWVYARRSADGFLVPTSVKAEEAPPLPPNLQKATEYLKGSQIAPQILGEGLVDHFVRTREWEVREASKAVTDWELQRYFELA